MGMLKFQTVERDSFFTHLDFRPKMVMIAVVSMVAFVWESPLLQIILACIIIISALAVGVKPKYIRLVITVMIPFYLLLLLTHGFFNVEHVKHLTGKSELTPMFTFPENWWLIGGGMMSWEGFNFGINAIFKTLSLVLVFPIAIFTTDVDTMIVGMVRARIPYKLAFIFSATLRFFPVFFKEIGMIMEAQRLRGLAMEKMNPIQRIMVYSKVAIPLILGSMVKSQQLEVVLQSKAFSGSPIRTYLHESKMGVVDYLLIAFFMVFLIVAVVLYATMGIGKFAGPI